MFVKTSLVRTPERRINLAVLSNQMLKKNSKSGVGDDLRQTIIRSICDGQVVTVFGGLSLSLQ